MFKVILTTERHGIADYNPVYGSEFQCEGVIESYFTIGTGKNQTCPSLVKFIALTNKGLVDGLSIKWDNGTNNSYRVEDIAVSSTDESVMGICNTIW